jgi:Tfp pilus assembly protein PilE
MTLTTILAVVVLISFLVTVFLAIASYAAYKLRERRRPKVQALGNDGPQFFERYFPPTDEGGERFTPVTGAPVVAPGSPPPPAP